MANNDETKPPEPDLWWVVILSAEGENVVRRFDAVEAVVAFMQTLAVGTPGCVFRGRRYWTTAGTFRYLVSEDGSEQWPLFAPPSVGPIDRSGDIGSVDDISVMYRDAVGEGLPHSLPGGAEEVLVEVGEEEDSEADIVE